MPLPEVLSKAELNPIALEVVKAVQRFMAGNEKASKVELKMELFEGAAQSEVLTPEDHMSVVHYLHEAAERFDVDIRAIPKLSHSAQNALNKLVQNSSALALDPTGKHLQHDSSRLARNKSHSLEPNRLDDELDVLDELADEFASASLSSTPRAEQISQILQLPVGVKTKAVKIPGWAEDTKLGSYLRSEAYPQKTWRISPSFRAGSFKKIRLAKDERGELSVFSTIYIDELKQKSFLKRKPLSLSGFETFQEVEKRLEHMNGPAAYRMVDEKGQVWQNQPLFPSDLFAFCSSGKAPTDQTAGYLHFMQSMTHSVAGAHQAKIMLLDIKPQNFLVAPDMTTSFRDLDISAPERSLQEGEYAGSRGFMAPEMVFGEGSNIGLKADVFSLGQTFICMLSPGTPDFFQTLSSTRTKADINDLRTFLQQPVLQRLDDFAFSGTLAYSYRKLWAFDSQFADFVFERMLAPLPSDRASIEEVAAALQEVQARKGFTDEQTDRSLEALAMSPSVRLQVEEVQTMEANIDKLPPNIDPKKALSL